MRVVVLLRGINVGGKNVIAMSALRTVFEGLGCTAVTTYIQSGNVICDAPGSDTVLFATAVEATLATTFPAAPRVCVVPADTLATIVDSAPDGFGSDPSTYRYDVWFVIPPTAAHDIADALKPRPGVDTVVAGRHAVYTRRLIAEERRSGLGRISQLPEYAAITIRNWNTTTRLVALLDGAGDR